MQSLLHSTRAAMRRIDSMVQSAETAAWVVLVIAAAILPWAGLEPPVADGAGRGMIALDSVVAAALIAAAVAQAARIVQPPDREPAAVRVAAWLLLLTLALLAGRILWILTTFGDVQLPPTMIAALLCLSAAVILAAIGRIIYRTAH